MTPHDAPESPVRRSEIFREQALQAWRGQEAESRVLLDLSPVWMRWAIAGIFILAGVGVLLAATTSIPNRASTTASARLSSGRDSILVDAVFALSADSRIRVGQTMSFRPQTPGAAPIDLKILSVAPYSTSRSVAETAARALPRRVLVHGGIGANEIDVDPLSITGPAIGGTVHVSVGRETLLHLFRPRTPAGAKS